MMYRLTVLLSALIPFLCSAQIVLDSSPVGIIAFETFGQEIPNDIKINVGLTIWWQPGGVPNETTDEPHYSGYAGLEFRGSSSLLYNKSGYGFETREIGGANRNASLFGMPEENDWVLHGPYSDKTLMRNALAYRLARDMGESSGHYAPRTRFCELLINGEYQGIYLLAEKIKVDDGRISEEGLNEDLGGSIQILKVDKLNSPGTQWWEGNYPPLGGDIRIPSYQVHHPKDLNELEFWGMVGWTRSVDDRLWEIPFGEGAAQAASDFLDIASFIDFFLINEAARNIDGYRLSAHFYRVRQGIGLTETMVMGPAWDFNLGWGNADYYDGWRTEGWHLHQRVDDNFQIPFWWGKLMSDPAFVEAVDQRWTELRQDVFSTERIHGLLDAWVDSLGLSIERNFDQWPVIGEYIWPNPFVGDSYEDELDRMRVWIEDRFEWMDQSIPDLRPDLPGDGSGLDWLVNPMKNGQLEVFLNLAKPTAMEFQLYDLSGRKLQVLLSGPLHEGRHYRRFNLQSLPAGLYVLGIQIESEVSSSKIFLPGF